MDRGSGEPELPGKAGVTARPWAGRAGGRNQEAVASFVTIKMKRWHAGSVLAVSN